MVIMKPIHRLIMTLTTLRKGFVMKIISGPSIMILFAAILLSSCGGGGSPAGTPPPTYTVGGTLSGLASGSTVTLENNGGDALTLSSNGTFTFATPLLDGAGYNVTIAALPADQPCTAIYGAATVKGADVNNVNVFCGPSPRGAFIAAGSLATARYPHTATLLPDGRVLVAGGSNNINGVLASAELYDPAGNSWSSAGSLATGRYAHTATLLPGGRVLVAGGYNGGYVASAELCW